jgi:SAM-dependent methyltransferase
MEFPWDKFFRDKITIIFSQKNYILDIGGGLRIDEKRNNRGKQNNFVDEYLPKVKYVVLDKVADYGPDIVGDIHNLPLADESVDAVICMNVLEHVEEPHKAMKEIYRVLKKGGYAYFDTPFIFFYHPMNGYYKDFYRFSRDAWEYMCKDYNHIEIQNVRGALGTVMNLIPFFTKRTKFFDIIDKFLNKQNSNQTSAYRVFCIK